MRPTVSRICERLYKTGHSAADGHMSCRVRAAVTLVRGVSIKLVTALQTARRRGGVRAAVTLVRGGLHKTGHSAADGQETWWCESGSDTCERGFP